MRTLISLVLLFLAAPSAIAATPFLRLGVGMERSRSVTIADVDCGATNPPALFGCGNGIDDRPFGARGDFGEAEVWELAAGVELNRDARVELAVARRDGFALDAEANFTGVAGAQPVSAEARSDSAMVIASVAVGSSGWRVRPFVGAGVGVARNKVGAIEYAFPGVDPNAVTITGGGEQLDFAWTAAAGASFSLTEHLALDLTLRYTDLGELRTEAGPATIIRPTRELTIDIAGTRTQLETLGVGVGVRWRM